MISAKLVKTFDLCTQADRTLDRSQGGLGIGLSLVQRLVELHGETVELTVLQDIGLPDMNGCEVARQLRQQPQTKDVRLIAMAGYGQDSDRQRSQEAGCEHHLVKPVDPQKLQDLLTRRVKAPTFQS